MPEEASQVSALPRRVAHATHALLEASREHNMPVKAGEVVIYDIEALDARTTGRALSRAQRLGFAACARPYWIPTRAAYDAREDLEQRFLADTETDDDS